MIPTDQSIVFNARQLSLFAQRNRDFSIRGFSQMERRGRVPDPFNFTGRIQALNAMIRARGQNENGNSLGGNHTYVSLADALETHIGSNQTLNSLIPTLNLIHAYAMGQIFDRQESDMHDLVEEYSPVEMEIDGGDDPLIDDESVDPMEMQAVQQAELNDVLEERDANIFGTQSQRLGIFEWMILELKSFDNPWRGAFDDVDPDVYELAPALLEGRVIQESASYEEYAAANPNSIMTQAEYNEIRTHSFEWLASELGKGFSASPLSSLCINLKLSANGNRTENERIVTLGLSREEETARQDALDIDGMTQNEFNEELWLALRFESILFLKKLVENHLHRIPKLALNQIVIWCARCGRLSLLNQILTNRLHSVKRESYIDAMEYASGWGHASCYEVLFDHYPHNNTQARRELLVGFASRGMKAELIYLLSDNYPCGLGAAAINEAFNAAVEADEYDLIACFFDAGVRPHDETLTTTFEFLVNSGAWNEVKPFLRPEISGFIQEESIILLLDKLSLKGINEETVVFFEEFFASPLFDRLPLESLTHHIEWAVSDGEMDFALVLLNSRRGGEVDRSKYEQMILNMLATNPENAMTLLGCSTHPHLSKESAAQLLLGSIACRSPAMARKVLEKVDPNDPIPRAAIIEAIQQAVGANNSAIVKEIHQKYHDLNVTVQEIEPLIARALTNKQVRMLLCLSALPSALQVSAVQVSQILQVAAENGFDLILQRPFAHLNEVSDSLIEDAFYGALSNRHIESARYLHSLRVNLAYDQGALDGSVISAASKGHSDVVEFLCRNFIIPAETLRLAYPMAEAGYYPDTAATLWDRIWHIHTSRPEPPLDEISPLKRLKTS